MTSTETSRSKSDAEHSERPFVVLFPGQGSQVVGMAKEIADHVPEADASSTWQAMCPIVMRGLCAGSLKRPISR